MPERTEETRVTRLGGGSEAAVTQEAGAELSGVHRPAGLGQRPSPLLTSSSATPLGGSLGPTGSETCPPRLLPCVSLTRCFSATATWQCLQTVLSVAAGGVCYCCLVGRGRGCCSIPSNAGASPSNGTSTFPSARQGSSCLSAFALALALPGMCSLQIAQLLPSPSSRICSNVRSLEQVSLTPAIPPSLS